MKRCNTCLLEKDESNYYKAKKDKLEGICKKCKSNKSKINKAKRPKIKFDPILTGNKVCKKCNDTKNINEFGVNRSLKDGRKELCSPCTYLEVNTARRQKRQIYKPLINSSYVPNNTSYIKGNCEVCNIEYEKSRSNHKKCQSCSDLSRDIQTHLSHKRSNKKIELSADLNKSQLSVEIAKKHINSNECFYCCRKYEDNNVKNIDHIIPVHLGGIHSKNNFIICCTDCNRSKNKMSLKDWLNLCIKISENKQKIFDKINTITNFKDTFKIKVLPDSCKVCEKSLLGKKVGGVRYCPECQIIIKKLTSSLTSTRKNESPKCSRSIIVELSKRWINQNNCIYCDCKFTISNNKSPDHILPFYLTGENKINNLAISCLNCNRAKSTFKINDWITLCQLISDNKKNILELADSIILTS